MMGRTFTSQAIFSPRSAVLMVIRYSTVYHSIILHHLCAVCSAGPLKTDNQPGVQVNLRRAITDPSPFRQVLLLIPPVQVFKSPNDTTSWSSTRYSFALHLHHLQLGPKLVHGLTGAAPLQSALFCNPLWLLLFCSVGKHRNNGVPLRLVEIKSVHRCPAWRLPFVQEYNLP